MSTNADDEKTEAGKSFPLDLASKLSGIKTIDAKPSLVSSQQLRNMRVLTHSSSSSGQTSVGTPTIITTNIMSQVLKQGQSQTQGSGSITVQRPTQITLTTPVVPQTPAYHVPRGPAVVANLAAPRSNVATAIRASMVVTQTTPAFVRPPRTPSPAQGTTWLATNATNGSQLKGSPSVLSPPIRAGTVANTTNKQSQIIGRSQAVSQNISNLRPTTTILQSAITVGQGNQIHPFKSTQNTTGIQAIGGTVTVAQVVPSRTQTLVYSTGNTHFSSTPRLTIANSVQGQRQISTPRPVAQVTATRLPINVPQTGTARIVTPQAALLTSGTRISTVSTSQQTTVIGAQRALLTSGTRISTVSTSQQTTVIGAQRIISTTQSQNVPLSRLSVSVPNQTQMAVTSNPQNRTLQTQTAKVITQPGPGAIHLTQMPTATIKSTQNIVTPTTRTINVQPAIVTQRMGSVVSSQAIPMAKVFPQPGDNQGGSSTANVFIHPPVTSVPRRTSPGPQNSVSQTPVSVPSTTVSYSIASGAYFFDTTANYTRPFNQQQTSFSTITQGTTQQIRPTNLGIVTNQSMRFNPIMVVETSRSQPQFTQETAEQTHQTTPTPTKLTSSPRPSILRKRDHEGSPLKSAKNLQTVLSSVL
ncbi:Histone deacetylase complex subunit SAP130 C-terminus [Popillia japonica]|uniref:Histone deacetylase complex subunit SAP130 C-terminus n=1 Tax=Popillia japonica TaxID=7064 RepID=A0AAW1K3B6_POPJA